MNPGTLEGIRVLDLSRLLPGGFCSLLLADAGADVVKVEDTGMGDYVRWSPPYHGTDEQQGLGTGKVSGGIALVLSKRIGYSADLHAAVGGRFNSDPEQVNIGNALHWGVGLNVPALYNVQLHAELTGASYQDADFEQTKPLDLVVGPLFWIKGFFIRPALSWNLNFNDRGLNSSSRSYTGRRISIVEPTPTRRPRRVTDLKPLTLKATS